MAFETNRVLRLVRLALEDFLQPTSRTGKPDANHSVVMEYFETTLNTPTTLAVFEKVKDCLHELLMR